ncbi:conjugal transfer protein TraD [Sphingomonas abietis]|uniref:Conjugal transfer protein TraD n=1 Tax=Sphingomonas abietis TaxID=3012344 RepID=A0ABY7NMX0_9SPHN|nr:conjugal transfer protein TraD [Sphingomonas abietis]WBO22869.1 conjugal transfer protein TraD [Sphingomonas abietis]
MARRRDRTRHLIELGGLVVKAGLLDLTGDDRAILYGALLDVAARLRGDDSDVALQLWRRRGRRAFESEGERHGSGASVVLPGDRD